MAVMPFTDGVILCSIVKHKLDCNEIWQSFMTPIMEQLGNKTSVKVNVNECKVTYTNKKCPEYASKVLGAKLGVDTSKRCLRVSVNCFMKCLAVSKMGEKRLLGITGQ